METNFYRDSEAVHLFIHLVLKANHRGRCFMFNGRLINIERGQILTGRKILSAETGISEQEIRTRLRLFVGSDIIRIKTTSKYSIITICNYNSYQGNGEGKRIQATSTATNTEPTDNQQITTPKNDKNDKNVKNEKNIYRGFAPPTLEEVQEYVKKVKYYDVDCHKWWNFYAGKGWMVGKNKMKDWHRAIATWHNFNIDEADKADKTEKKKMDKFWNDYKKQEGIT